MDYLVTGWVLEVRILVMGLRFKWLCILKGMVIIKRKAKLNSYNYK
jgi:hypothetical protein